VCKVIVRSREYGEMEESDMILVQGPSCLFSAVIEKPFFSSSRQVTSPVMMNMSLVTHLY
jgi:hypothetical protein